MSLLVLGVSHQSAPWTSWRRWPPSTSDRPCRWSAPVTLWAKPCCCRPATASRCTPRSPDSTPLWNRSPRFWPRVPGCRRTNCPPTCTSTTRMPRSGMPSGSPVASTRWSWAMSRSWGSSGRRSRWPSSTVKPVAACTNWLRVRCGSASACRPTPPSAVTAPRWWRSRWPRPGATSARWQAGMW